MVHDRGTIPTRDGRWGASWTHSTSNQPPRDPLILEKHTCRHERSVAVLEARRLPATDVHEGNKARHPDHLTRTPPFDLPDEVAVGDALRGRAGKTSSWVYARFGHAEAPRERTSTRCRRTRSGPPTRSCRASWTASSTRSARLRHEGRRRRHPLRARRRASEATPASLFSGTRFSSVVMRWFLTSKYREGLSARSSASRRTSEVGTRHRSFVAFRGHGRGAGRPLVERGHHGLAHRAALAPRGGVTTTGPRSTSRPAGLPAHVRELSASSTAASRST